MATNDINLRDQRLAELRDTVASSQSALDAAKVARDNVRNKRTGVGGSRTTREYQAAKAAVKTASAELKKQKGLLGQEQAAVDSTESLMRDITAVSDQDLQSVLGESYTLGRLREDENVQNSLAAYENATNLRVQRDAATAGLQNAESSSNRALMSRLAASGVKGGLASGALTDLAATNLRNRASLESNLALNNVAAQKELATFQTQISQFDLGQQTAENNLRTRARLGLAQNSQLARSGATQAELAQNMGNMSSGK